MLLEAQERAGAQGEREETSGRGRGFFVDLHKGQGPRLLTPDPTTADGRALYYSNPFSRLQDGETSGKFERSPGSEFGQVKDLAKRPLT